MPKTKQDRTKALTYLTTFSCALATGSLVFALTSVGTSQAELSKLKADTVPVVIATQPIDPGATESGNVGIGGCCALDAPDAETLKLACALKPAPQTSIS